MSTKIKYRSESDSSRGSKDFNHNNGLFDEPSLLSLIEERESLKSLGLPYWYTDYIRSKRKEKIRCNTPSSKGSDENSNYEIDIAERNISRLPTSSEEQSSSNNSKEKDDSNKNDETPKLSDSTLTDGSNKEMRLKDTNLPDIEIPLRRCQSFPRLASCRKIDNINIVLPRKPSPLEIHTIEQDTGVFIDETIHGLPHLRQNFPESTDDSLFYGVSKSASKMAAAADARDISRKLERDRHQLPKVLEQSVSSNMMSSTINTIATVDSDMDVHICNLLAASTPLSSSHGLNVLVEQMEDRRETDEWVAQIRAMIINAPRLSDDRRKSQPPLNKKDAMSGPSSTFASRLSSIMRIFRKTSPKKPKQKPINQKGHSERFSLDPQAMRKLTEQINKPIVLK